MRQAAIISVLLIVIVLNGCASSPKVLWRNATTAYNSALLAFTKAREQGVIDDERYALIEAWRVVAAEALDLMELYAFSGEKADAAKFRDSEQQFYTALGAIQKQTGG